jgi:hypothetical protein
VNNQMLVFDMARGTWVDVWEGLPTAATHLIDAGPGQLIVFGAAGTAWRALVDGCWDDEGAHPGMVYEQVVELGDQRAASAEVEVDLEHHHGAVAVSVQSEHVGEGAGPARLMVPDARRYRQHGRPAYDLANSGDDQLAPGRQNYAVLLPEQEFTQEVWTDDEDNPVTIDTGATVIIDPALLPGSGGIEISAARGLMLGVRQADSAHLRTRARSKTVAVRVQTMRGMVAVQRIGVRAGALAFGRRRRG